MSASKRSAFSLLGQPQPLPDDDAPSVETPRVRPAPHEAAEPASTAEPHPSPRGDKAPPGTIRLNEAAGRSLWEAFAAEKATNPFLSYRQFASDVIARGLKARARAHR